MMKTMTTILAGIFVVVFSVMPVQADDTIPAAVPDDFPFPEDANLQVQDSTSATMIQVAVAFSFKSDPAEIYSTFKNYAVENGYEVSSEDAAEYNFSSVDYGSGNGIGLRISEMRSVNIATVTFSGPNKS